MCLCIQEQSDINPVASNFRYEEAISQLQKAIVLNPNYAIAYHALGYTLAHLGLGAKIVRALANVSDASTGGTFRGHSVAEYFGLIITNEE